MSAAPLLPLAEWREFAARLFVAAGLDADKAETVARLLVLTDAIGRATHGLAQVGAYLDELASGGMTKTGAPQTLVDRGATVVWDGGYRPGLWLMDEATSLCLDRVAAHGVITFAMRRSHHIGCLATLAKRAADAGCFVTVASSGPHTKVVAPYGGREGLFSPDPFAFGFPAGAHPVLFDGCASITSVSMTREKAAAGALFDHPWLLDHEGRPTRDPAVMERREGRGSLVLLGGAESGHKGFGLALMVEALTQGLAGHGRADAPTRWGASVYMQLIDPAAFAGREAFLRQTEFFAERCRANAPIDPDRPVRLPGDEAERRLRAVERDGLALAPSTMQALARRAERLGVAAPATLAA